MMNSSDFYTQLVDSEIVCVIHMTKRDSIDSYNSISNSSASFSSSSSQSRLI
jgi:hypothetical protein